MQRLIGLNFFRINGLNRINNERNSMKMTRVVSVAGAIILMAGIFLGLTFLSRAQTQDSSGSAALPDGLPDSAVRIAAEAQGLSLVLPDQVPPDRCGTFWIVTSDEFPTPWPFLPSKYDLASTTIYSMGAAGEFLVDGTTDTNGMSAADLEAQGNMVLDFIAQAQEMQANAAMHTLARAMDLEMDNEDAGSTFTIDTNGLWLEITNVANGLAYLNLHNGTDYVYEVWSKQDLTASNWDIETEVFPGTNQDVMPFTVAQLERTNLFIWARDWTGITSGSNETPEWWFWEYFGTVALSDTNLDSQGNTLLYDYQNSLDPNVIQFSVQFTNNYVNTSNAPTQLNILGGVPSYMAVLINDMNQTDAVWQPYTSSNIVVTLGSTNGAYSIYVGLRGLPPDATQTWQWTSVTLYSDVPMLTITNPTTSTVSQSPIQLQGFASNPLDSLTFDVSNAAGILTNQTGFLTGQFYDTNLLAYTTNYFECSGIVLNNGTNVITLHATDWAGNTANVSFKLDYSPNTNPPVLNLVWPQDGTVISGSNFTLKAQVSDPTASVTALVNGNAVQGLIEQNGSVWVQNQLLNAGTNAVSLIASNAFGGVSVTNFNVVGNDVGLVINSLTSDQLNQSSVTVTGSINDPSDTITVNGTPATVNPDGSWEADSVPVNPTGMASLNVQVGDSNNNPLSSGAANQAQPAMVVLAGYSGSINQNGYFFAARLWPTLDVETINWAYDTGGNETDTGYTPNDAGTAENNINGSDSLPADGPGFATPELPLAWDYFSVNTPYGDGGNFQRSSEAQLMIAPSGQEAAGTTNLYLVYASAMAFSNPAQDFGEEPGDLPIAPETLQLNGQTLINSGITNDDGSVRGLALVSGLAGANVPLKLTAPIQAYSFNNMQVTNVQLKVFANGIDLSTNTPEFCVGQAVTNQLIFDPPLPSGTQVSYQWTASLDFIDKIVPPTTNEASTSYFLDLTLLTNNPAPVWWYSGGYKYIWCIATVQLPNGQTVTITGRGNVSISQPVISGFDDEPPSYPTNCTDGGTLYLQLGDNNAHGDMRYEVHILSSYPGKGAFIQLINRDASNGSVGSGSLGTGGQYWLDTSNPYQGPFSIPANTDYPLFFADNPGVADVASGLSLTTRCTDQFRDYIVFRPNAGIENNNIFVTLGVVSGGNPSWGWSASTTWFGGWSTPTGTVTRPTWPDNNDAFPTWIHTYTNLQ